MLEKNRCFTLENFMMLPVKKKVKKKKYSSRTLFKGKKKFMRKK